MGASGWPRAAHGRTRLLPAEHGCRSGRLKTGTSRQDKRLVLFDSGHAVPLTPAYKETLDWLDHYLGPVK